MEKDLENKIRESIQNTLREDYGEVGSLGRELEDFEELPMDAIDMPIQDKGLFNLGLDRAGDESDLAKYRKSKDTQGNYESGYEDDKSVSPGYFNEEDGDTSMDDFEELPLSAIDMPIQDKGIFNLNTDSLSDEEDMAKYRRMKDIQGDYESGYFSETYQVTSGQLKELIKEGIQELHDQAMEQNRLEQINQQMNATSDVENWAAARKSALEQRAKQTLNWEHVTKREKLVSESTEAGKGPAFKNVDMKDVEDIMGRAGRLMAEAKKKYQDISKKD